MALSVIQITELERRGVANVRAMVQMAGKAARSEIPLGTTGGNPAREDVDEWLIQKEATVARRHERRRTGWTVLAAIATGICAGTAVLEALRW